MIQVTGKLRRPTDQVDAARSLLSGVPADPAVLQAFVLFSVLGVLASWSFIKAMREAVA